MRGRRTQSRARIMSLPESKERVGAARRERKILVAPAWPYAAGKRHLGHVVGFAVPADIYARYHRLKGNDVLMISGTDEHGTPVMVTADREGVSPREIAERYNRLIREDLRDLGISYDCFTRTTTRNHARVTTDIFRTLYEHGCLIERETLGRVFGLERQHASGPLHRGHVSDLRLHGGARRPVRQLRKPARPDRSDRPALDHRRHDAGVQGDEAPLPRPPAVRGPAPTLDRGRNRAGDRTCGTSRSRSSTISGHAR